MVESKTSPRRLEAVEKQRKALELRMAGRTWQEIGRAVGYSNHSGAIAAVNAALLKTLREPSDRYRALTVERLTKIIATFWPLMLAHDEKATVIVLRAIEQFRTLLGLDARVPLPGSSRENPLWTQSVEAVDLSNASDAELDSIIDKAKAIKEAGRIVEGEVVGRASNDS